MPLFAAGVGARRAAMRDIGSGARRTSAAKSGIPAGYPLLARGLSPELRSGWRQAKRSFAESRVAGPCRWARIACGLSRKQSLRCRRQAKRSFAESPAPNRASTACNAVLLLVRNPG